MAPSLLYEPGPAGTQRRPVGDKLGDSLSIKDFGAVGNCTGAGTGADDTAAIQAAVNYMLTVGGSVYFPTGIYRVTGTIKVGTSIWLDNGAVPAWATLAGRTDNVEGNLSTYFSPVTQLVAGVTREVRFFNLDNEEANKSAHKPITLEFAPHVVIAAEFSPSQLMPVLEWNLPVYRNACALRGNNTVICHVSKVIGGRYDGYSETTTPQTANKLIGIANAESCLREVSGFVFGKLEVGYLGVQNYWLRLADLRFDNCVEGLNTGMYNSGTVQNCIAWYCDRGLVFDGTSSRVDGFHTQNCITSYRILFADCCSFSNAYLEDVSTENGAGKFVVELGKTENITRISHARFEGIRIGAVRSSKKSFRLWGLSQVSFEACRESGHGVDIDTNSHVTLENCDSGFVAAIPAKKRSVINGHTHDLIQRSPSSIYDKLEEANFTLPAINFGAEVAVGAAIDSLALNLPVPLTRSPFVYATGQFVWSNGANDNVEFRLKALTSTAYIVTAINRGISSANLSNVILFMSVQTFGNWF